MAYRFSHPTVFTHARDTQASARLLIRRIGAVLFLIGGLTMVLTLLAPSAGRPSAAAFVPVGLACFGFAAYLAFAPRAPDWALLGLRATVACETAAGEVGLTVSIGLCESGPETTSEELLRSADIALYSAKGAGRNCVAVYGEPALA